MSPLPVILNEVKDLQLSFLPAREPPRTADELLAVLRDLGLKRIARCRLTRNRNVMVSHTGSDLRVHEGYLTAPYDVLAAIVDFTEGPTRRVQLAARRRLLAFPIDTRNIRPRRREITHPDDLRMEARLTQAHAELNGVRFGGTLRPLRVRVSRRMRRRLGHYVAATGPDPAEIAISRRHVRRHGWAAALETLLHEMVHQWQDERGLPIDHGQSFRGKAREVGIPPAARRTIAA